MEILADHILEFLEGQRVHIELPLEILAHLALHLINFPELEHALCHNAPRFVGVRIVTDDLACEHECGNEETVSRRSACGGEAGFQTLEKHEGGKRDGGMKLGAVEGIRDKVGELDGGARRTGGELRTGKKMGDEATSETRYGLMTIEGVSLPWMGLSGRGLGGRCLRANMDGRSRGKGKNGTYRLGID